MSRERCWTLSQEISCELLTNEAPPQTDEVYFRSACASRIIREMAPVDSGELQTVLANDLSRQSSS
jgi:hypothetical protein